MSDTKPQQPVHLYIIIAALAGMVIWQRNGASPSPAPAKSDLAASVRLVVPAMRKGYAQAFNDVAASVESGKVKTDREFLEAIKPLMLKARNDAESPVNASLEAVIPEDFAGKESDIAAMLRKAAKAW